jgi:outer membrane protein
MRPARVVLAALPLLAGAFVAGQALADKPLPHPVGPYPADTLPSSDPDTVAHTLAEALGIAYETNPTLTGERAHQRSIDENVPAALAGWRPVVSVAANYGSAVGKYVSSAACGNQLSAFEDPLQAKAPGASQPACYSNGIVDKKDPLKYFLQNGTFADTAENNRNTNTETLTVTQYLYRAGKTTATTHQAENAVYAERANLIAQEETVFTNTITAYVTYIEDAQLLQLDRQNEQVLGDELRAVNDQFKVGELTRTDVAQAESALAQAIATRQTAEGTLQTAVAQYIQQIGVAPPKDLADPQALQLPVKSENEAADWAVHNNPNVINAIFTEAEAKDSIDVAFAALGPQLYVQGTGFQNAATTISNQTSYGAQVTINLSLPLYQGGAEYAAVRQARQNYQQAVRLTEVARRTAREAAVQAWDTLVAARAAIASSRIAVRSAEIALEGVERQALVGSATTQEVLIQQQNLLAAQITLVQNVTSVVTASYGVAAAIGRLTARDLGLAVPLYDETAYYNAVRHRLWGTGDYAVHQPGR